jgi:hypothetical protein
MCHAVSYLIYSEIMHFSSLNNVTIKLFYTCEFYLALFLSLFLTLSCTLYLLGQDAYVEIEIMSCLNILLFIYCDKFLLKILNGRPTGKRPLGRPRRRSEDNIRMNLKEININKKNGLIRNYWRVLVNAALDLRCS